MNGQYWVKKLNLLPHPEGGYYKETYRSSDLIQTKKFDGTRNVSTAIYFLLEDKNKSHLHRIKSDELWFFHEGDVLEIVVLNKEGASTIQLGKNLDNGESLQAIVPAGSWFGARLKKRVGFALVSCTVAPGFDFNDFELGRKEDLIAQHPQHIELINEMAIENSI